MLNVVLPMAGVSPLAEELGYPYPSPLVEICGKTLIQRVIENLGEFESEICVTAVLRAEDCRRFHLDSTIKLLAGGTANVIVLQKDTTGALCSVLMAIEKIGSSAPLIIANSDQIFDPGVLRTFLDRVRALGADAACPTFGSVHPRWSYLRLDGERVVEAVEKNPVSRHAVAGIYYFKSGAEFSRAAMKAILNSRDVDGKFFVSAVLNEFILDEKVVVGVPIDEAAYHSFFTAQRVAEFEYRQRSRG